MCESYNFYLKFCNKIHVKNTDLCLTKTDRIIFVPIGILYQLKDAGE